MLQYDGSPATSVRKANFVVEVVVLECCEKTLFLVSENTDIVNSGQKQRKYQSGAAKRKLKSRANIYRLCNVRRLEQDIKSRCNPDFL